MSQYQPSYPAASPNPPPSLVADCDAGEFRIDQTFDQVCNPLECGLTVVCRAAADAETGGPAGRPAFAAPKRPPPRKGAIDVRRVVRRAAIDAVTGGPAGRPAFAAPKRPPVRCASRAKPRSRRRRPRARSPGQARARAGGESSEGPPDPAAADAAWQDPEGLPFWGIP